MPQNEAPTDPDARACFPFMHSYGAWADVLQSNRGAVLVQERRCQKCNKAQRRQTVWLGGEFDTDGDGILP